MLTGLKGAALSKLVSETVLDISVGHVMLS